MPQLAKSPMDVELERWSVPRSQIVPGSQTSESPDGVRGVRIEEHLEFPRMLYRGHTSGPDVDIRVVRSRDEQARFEREGWATTSTAAVQQRDALAEAVGQAAAEAAFGAQRMSAKAREEYAQAEATDEGHVTDVKRKPGRPKRQPVGE